MPTTYRNRTTETVTLDGRTTTVTVTVEVVDGHGEPAGTAARMAVRRAKRHARSFFKDSLRGIWGSVEKTFSDMERSLDDMFED